MTYDEDTQAFTLSTGKVFYAERYTLAPDGDDLHYGEDGIVSENVMIDGKQVYRCAVDMFTVAERMEIALYMIARWGRWAETGTTEMTAGGESKA